MEEPISILTPGGSTVDELNVQQPLYINNYQAKLIETENRLNQVFEEYTGRIESFMMMLDALNEGVLLVNQKHEVCFCNEIANSLLQQLGSALSSQIYYRPLASEEILVLNHLPNSTIRLRINNFYWNGEQCNIFILGQSELVVPETVAAKQVLANEPFSQMMHYLRLIAGHEANGRLPEAAQCAELAGKTIAQSDKLLSDIKAFVKLSNHKPVTMQVSMQKIAGDVLKSMGPEIEEAGIEITVSELPETMGDKDLITNLLKQLISNSVKFRNKNKKATIDIGHDKSDGQFIFCIRDNGIGISKKHHEEVFNLFFSLNDVAEYPGNGMGLAICKKIVELHNGKIWVESLPGHGSNFYFKLGKK